MLYELMIGQARPVPPIGTIHRCRDDEPVEQIVGSTRQRILYHLDVSGGEMEYQAAAEKVGGRYKTFVQEAYRMEKLKLLAIRKRGLYRYLVQK